MTDEQTAPKRVFILLGPPGSGKGTQADYLVDSFNLYHIDTGHCLRTEIAEGSDLGLQAKAYMDRGELVPIELVLQVIQSAMKRIPEEKKGYLFDGFPRNMEQAKGLETILSNLNLSINAVLYMDVPRGELLDRLVYRVSCSNCSTKYNLKTNPPKQDKICDVCGNDQLITRQDDKPEVIDKRLEAYENETKPLIDFYQQQDKLKKIDANQPIELVFAQIQRTVGVFFDPSDKILV